MTHRFFYLPETLHKFFRHEYNVQPFSTKNKGGNIFMFTLSDLWNSMKIFVKPIKWIFKFMFKAFFFIIEKGLVIFATFSLLGVFACYLMYNSTDQSGSSSFFMRVLAIIVLIASVALGFFLNKLVFKGKGKAKPLSATSLVSSLLNPKQAESTLPIQSNNPCGVIFGKKGAHYIVKPEELDGHILIVGGVGSGKSSCIAIPTLRAWNESVFAIDIKGELYEKTKDYRPNIRVFNPLDETSYGYDPFFCLRTSHNPSQEARAIAQAIVPLPTDTKDPFWIESAQNIFTAAILHYSAQDLSFIDTIRQIQGSYPKALILELCESPIAEARYCVNSLAEMEDKTLSSIMAELSKNIVHFVTDRHLSSALSRDKNITPDDLEFGNDIYINIPEHLLRQWKTLLALIVNQFLTHFEQRSEANTRPILFLLDEFPRLGKISAMLDGLATLRSKKISICLIVQSLAQLDAIYGQNERKVISDTCAYKAILGATDADTQEYFSRLVGTYDKSVTSHGANKEAYTGFSKGTSTNTQEVEKRVIPPHEFGMLKDIVLLTPFAMPLEKPNKNISSVDFVMSFFTDPAANETCVPFCRVDKVPYYAQDGK